MKVDRVGYGDLGNNDDRLRTKIRNIPEFLHYQYQPFPEVVTSCA